MNPPHLEAELETARSAARAAGRLLKDRLGRASNVEHKGRRDLVTELDLAAQSEIIGRLQRAFPGDRIWAEEEASRPDLTGRVWIVDPLDGTTNYVHGLPAYCVSIALSRDGQLQAGAIFDPERDELFWAGAGQGAWLGRERISASGVDSLEESLLVTGFPYNLEDSLAQITARLERMLVRSQGVRRLGSAALDLAYVACGRLDAFWEDGLKPWDMAAGVLLVREAGGRVSALDGGPFDLTGGQILASNGLIHQEMVEDLRL